MRGLITHEESQTVMMAFNKLPGRYFFSNDLKPASGGMPSMHFQGDCFEHIESMYNSIGIDFLGMHPDCTKLTNAGIRWLSSKEPRDGYYYSKEWSDFNGYDTYINPRRWDEMVDACNHFKKCHEWLVKVGKGYIENPRMHPYAARIIGIPSTQYIHPYYFGSPQMKETHLWIVGLQPLKRTSNMEPPKDKKERLKWQDVWMCSPGPKRAEIRSKTDPKVAAAFAEQWGYRN
jgi:hypothetical protein